MTLKSTLQIGVLSARFCHAKNFACHFP